MLKELKERVEGTGSTEKSEAGRVVFILKTSHLSFLHPLNPRIILLFSKSVCCKQQAVITDGNRTRN